MMRKNNEKNFGDFEDNSAGRRAALPKAAVIFGILLIVAGFLYLRLRNGVQIKAPQDKEIWPGAELVLYRQDDERWGEERLGDSEYTMRSSGCLVSSIASAVSMESGTEVTPGVLNERFSGEQVYDTAGNLLWERLNDLGEYRVDVYGEASAEVIDACLSEGRYPVARVRMYALGNIHYVLIVGVRDGEYLCMDPLQDKITKLSSYGNRVYAVRCVSLIESG